MPAYKNMFQHIYVPKLIHLRTSCICKYEQQKLIKHYWTWSNYYIFTPLPFQIESIDNKYVLIQYPALALNQPQHSVLVFQCWDFHLQWNFNQKEKQHNLQGIKTQLEDNHSSHYNSSTNLLHINVHSWWLAWAQW